MIIVFRIRQLLNYYFMCSNYSKLLKTGSDAVASHLYFGDFAYFQPLDLWFRNYLINVFLERRGYSTPSSGGGNSLYFRRFFFFFTI